MQLRRHGLAAVLTSIACLILCPGMTYAASGAAPQNQMPSQENAVVSHPLVGTWVVTVSETPTGVQFPSLQALVTYGPGVTRTNGTVIETEDDAFAPAAGLFGPGHGVWQRTSPNHFHYAFLIHQYDPNGNLITVERDDASIKIDGDGNSFQGTAHFVVKDTSGNVLFSGDALLSATRFKLDS